MAERYKPLPLPQRFERSGLGSLGDRIRDYKGLGMGRRFPQMPMLQPTRQPLPRGPELIPIQQEVRGMDRFTPEQIEAMKNQYISTMPVGPVIPFRPFPEEMPRAPSPEEITQQRIDQVSQFEQEPMMEPRYGAFGGSATNLPDYTTRTSRYPSVDWETIRPEGGHPLRFADAKFDPQRIGYADTGRRSDSGRPYALPGGYAGGGIANLINYYRR